MKDDAETAHNIDRLQECVPEDLRRDWILVPQQVITQVALACLLIGAALALTAAGFTLGIEALKWTWPLVLVGLMLARRLLPWWRGDAWETQMSRLRKGD